VKFTSRYGRIDVLLRRVSSHVEIIVGDTGVGIKPELLPQIFDRFRQADSSTTRRFGGLGLGLSIVKQLVELHGGTVRADSPGEGHGATFTVALPVRAIREGDDREHPTTVAAPAIRYASIDLTGLRVLVVDDEPDARDLVVSLLADANATAASAASADEALEAIRRDPPDVLVSDIGMPDRDGYQLMRAVRALPAAQGGKIPAIALTAFARSEDRTRALIAGYQVHVAKPIEPQELIVTIASLTGRMGDPGPA
jgi:CheY-like chemotaxis protein